MRKSGQNKNLNIGFTLVELLVVISIIALLLAMLLPALSKAQEQARRIVCAKNIQQLGIASTAYFNDYKKFWAWFDEGGGSYFIYDGRQQSEGVASRTRVYWINHGMLFRLNYIKDAKIYYCPTSQKTTFKYKDYFDGGAIEAGIKNCTYTGVVRSTYISRNYDVIDGKAVHISLTSSGGGSNKCLIQVNSLKRPDSKLALLSDTFTYDRGGHLNRFYNVLYADGHMASYDDHLKVLAASALYHNGNWDDEAVKEQTILDARERFGEVLVGKTRDSAWPIGWLYLDRR
jgi:prepilin-type N-terminal cleavage/methylation domain-containing protein